MNRCKRFPVALRTLLSVLFCAGTLISGCQSSSRNGEGPENQAKIELTGNTVGSHVVIDTLLTFDVTNPVRTQFRLKPGRHHVRIERQGNVLVNETVSLARGQTLNIAVP